MSWLKFLKQKDAGFLRINAEPVAPPKTPKPDRFIGKIPEDKILDFFSIWEDDELRSKKSRYWKAKLWLFIHSCFPEEKGFKPTEVDPKDLNFGTRNFSVEVSDEMALEIGVYQKYPGVFLEDEKEDPVVPTQAGPV